MSKVIVPEKLHAELGASSADRWMNCTGSVALVRNIPNPETEYTQEGTAAHTLAEMALKRGMDPDVWVGTAIEGVEVTEEMAEAVKVFVGEARFHEPSDGFFAVEQRFSLEALNPPAPMFGTADIVMFDRPARTLRVMDYKHGVGYAVPAVGNPQLRYYALGAVLMMDPADRRDVDRIVMTIVQPRAGHADGIIRSDECSPIELAEFATLLMQKAREATGTGAPLNAGSWCRFCRAKAICPAQYELAQQIAEAEFGGETLPTFVAPETLPMATLLRVLDHADLIESWLRDVRRYVQGELEAGRDVPGWKLVPKRAVRKWASEEALKQWADTQGLTEAEIYEQKLRSVAQVEKTVGKGNIPDDLIVKESSGTNLAPAADARPAISAGPDADFGKE